MRHWLFVATIAVVQFLALPPATAQPDVVAEAAALIESGDVEAAADRLTAHVKRNKKDAAALSLLGQLEYGRGNAEASVKWLEKAASVNPEEIEYQLALGDAYAERINEIGTFGKMRMAGKLRKAYERAVELDPELIDARYSLMMFYIRAPGIAGGSKEKALEQAKEISKRDPIRGKLAEAMVYRGDDKNVDATIALREVVRLDPDSVEAHIGLGNLLTEQGEYQEALDVMRGFLETHVDAFTVRYQVGRTVSIWGQELDVGRRALTRYLEEYAPQPGEPGHEWASYRLGLIERHDGKVSAARTAFERSLELKPDHEESKAALKALKTAP